MAVSKEDVLDAISKMTVMEVVELISDMEKKFNVTAAAPVAEAQTEFTVTMSEFGANKVGVIRSSARLPALGSRKPRTWWKAFPRPSRKAFRRPMPTQSRRRSKTRAARLRSSDAGPARCPLT